MKKDRNNNKKIIKKETQDRKINRQIDRQIERWIDRQIRLDI